MPMPMPMPLPICRCHCHDTDAEILNWPLKSIFLIDHRLIEAVVWRHFAKKVFLKISQNSQENICARVSFLIKLKALGCRLWYRCFPVNFVKFLRTPFLQNISGDCFWNKLIHFAFIQIVTKTMKTQK